MNNVESLSHTKWECKYQMLLQQEMANPIWGTAAADANVTVTFNGLTVLTIAVPKIQMVARDLHKILLWHLPTLLYLGQSEGLYKVWRR